jgi:hypothetical protein
MDTEAKHTTAAGVRAAGAVMAGSGEATGGAVASAGADLHEYDAGPIVPRNCT